MTAQPTDETPDLPGPSKTWVPLTATADKPPVPEAPVPEADGPVERAGKNVAGWARDLTDRAAGALGVAVAERELGQTDDPRLLLHGDPEAITGRGGQLRRFAAAFTTTADGLRATTAERWTGAAADGFRRTTRPQPERWATAATACEQAAEALDDFAHTVAWARRQADEALSLYQDAERRTQHAEAAYQRAIDEYNTGARAYNRALALGTDPGPAPAQPAPFQDPGEVLRQRARAMLRRARQQRDTVAIGATAAFSRATELAPPIPKAGERVRIVAADHLVRQAVSANHFTGGALKAVGDVARLARQLNPYDPYNATHPATYLDGLSSTAAGLIHTGLRPTELVTGLLGTGWGSDPAESLGKLTTNLALGAVGGGGGAAATAGKTAVKATEKTAAKTAADTARSVADRAGPRAGAARSTAAENPSDRPTPPTQAQPPVVAGEIPRLADGTVAENVQAALDKIAAGEKLSQIEKALAGLDNIDTSTLQPHPAPATATAHLSAGPAIPATGSQGVDALHALADRVHALERELPRTKSHGDIGGAPGPESRHRSGHAADDPTPPSGTRSLDAEPAGSLGEPPASPAAVEVPPPLRRDEPVDTHELLERYVGEHDRDHPNFANVGFRGEVHYMSPAEREQHRLFVYEGRWYRASDGLPFDTHGAVNHWDEEAAIYVTDEHGNFYASTEAEIGRLHHSSLAAGQPVACAGEMIVDDGILKELSNKSGHYRPTWEQFTAMLKMLLEQGGELPPTIKATRPNLPR